LVQRQRALEHAAGRQLCLVQLLALSDQARAQVCVGAQARNALGQRRSVLGGHEQARVFVAHDLGHPAHARGHHGHPRGQGPADTDGKGFAAPGHLPEEVLVAAGGEERLLDPPVFSNPLNITNRFFPFGVDDVKVFAGKSDGARTAVVDLYRGDTRTFQVNGNPIETRLLQETEFEDGVQSEISYNFFAQADDGTVYYFGEIVDIYENGKVVKHDGSWLVGGAKQPGDPVETGNAPKPNVFMPANPETGDTFKPEDLLPIVDETVTVLKAKRRVAVPAGKFRDCLKLRETSELSSAKEYKWYAPGVGVIKTQQQGEVLKLLATNQ